MPERSGGSCLQVVKIIRGASDSTEASGSLQQSFNMSREQSEGVLNLSLRRLTSLEAQNLQTEHDTLIDRCYPVLSCLCTLLLQWDTNNITTNTLQGHGSPGLAAAAKQGARRGGEGSTESCS